MKKFKIISSLSISLFLLSNVFAHSLTPSPIDYPDSVTKKMCDRKDEIKQQVLNIRATYKPLDEKNSDVRSYLEDMKNGTNDEKIEELIDLNRKGFSNLYSKYMQINVNYNDIQESTCMDDDGYYWIKTNNKKLKSYIDEYNKNTEEYLEFLKNDLLPKVEQLN